MNSRWWPILLLAVSAPLAALDVSVHDLHLSLPDGWEVASTTPPSAEALCIGPAGQRLVVVRVLEPEGLAAGHQAWLDAQVTALGELLSQCTLTDDITITVNNHQWRQVTYHFSHSDRAMHQCCWLTLRVHGGITEAWVVTASATQDIALLPGDWPITALTFTRS